MHDKYIVHFISKTRSYMLQFLEHELANHELDELIPSQGNILTALYESKKSLTMKEISKKIGKDKSTVTALIQKLIDLGYVTKEKSTYDKRVTYIALTSKALEIEEQYNSICMKLNQTAYEGFSKEEKTELLRLLKKLNLNFKNADHKYRDVNG